MSMASSEQPIRTPSESQDSRRMRAEQLKRREDMKDMLLHRFSDRYGGRGAVSDEVDSFISSSAPMTEANLVRLERRLQKQSGGARHPSIAGDAFSVCSVSAYTNGSTTGSHSARGSIPSRRPPHLGVRGASSGRGGEQVLGNQIGSFSARGQAGASASSRSSSVGVPRFSSGGCVGSGSFGHGSCESGFVGGGPSGGGYGDAPGGGGGYDHGSGAFDGDASGFPPSVVAASVGDTAYGSAAQSKTANAMEWAVLDKLAGQMHKQDAFRQKVREQELQQRIREDLGKQVADVQVRQEREKEADQNFHDQQTKAFSDWQMNEIQKQNERQAKLRAEKLELDKQLQESQAKRDEEKRREKQEAEELAQKLQEDIVSERKRVEDRWAAKRVEVQKALEISNESAKLRDLSEQQKVKEEDQSEDRYSRLQEMREREARAKMEAEGQVRQIRQAVGQRRQAEDREKRQNDSMKASAERREKNEQDRMRENEQSAKAREQSVETQAFLLQQMREKQMKRQDEQEGRKAMRKARDEDTQAFKQIQQEKAQERRYRNFQHKAELERQISSKLTAANSLHPGDVMSEVELRLNKDLLERVSIALSELPASVSAPRSELGARSVIAGL